ncbi:MAG: glycosyltransferase family 9 protein [Synergistaceae bacterium]|jgi:ADP-heptose:LPS heptosyltransferase|nr:glycosyltransferase family 9 protein [Synergistaceae bacterium]
MASWGGEVLQIPAKNPNPWPKAGDRVLWIRFSAFGDVLQTAASAHRFKIKYPDVRVTFMTRPIYGDSLKIQPYIDDVLLWDNKKRPFDFFKVASRVRAANFKWLFSFQRGSAAACVAALSRVEQRFGYNSGMQFIYKNAHWDHLDLLGVESTKRDIPGIFTAPEDREIARSMLSGLPEKKLFAIIGASKPQKFWPVRHWIKFLAPLLEEGWGVALNGHGEMESRVGSEITEALRSDAVLNLVDRAAFPIMAALAEASTVAVGNDTGPLHLAALVGTPTLGFFGITDANWMNFRMPWFRELRVSCREAGCRNYGCPVDCLADISPERALAAFRSFADDTLTLP